MKPDVLIRIIQYIQLLDENYPNGPLDYSVLPECPNCGHVVTESDPDDLPEASDRMFQKIHEFIPSRWLPWVRRAFRHYLLEIGDQQTVNLTGKDAGVWSPPGRHDFRSQHETYPPLHRHRHKGTTEN